MDWREALNIGIPLVVALLVLVPKLARSILFESLSHPLRRTEIRRDAPVAAAHK